VKTTGLSLVLILLAGSLVAPIGFSVAETSSQTVPAAPTNLSATTVSSSQISLSWTAPVNATLSHVNGYKIEASTGCIGIFNVLVANTSNTNTEFSNTGLTNGTCYQYRVFAHNSVGTSAASNNATATTLQTQVPTQPRVPSAPTGLSVTSQSSSSLKITWTAPADQGSSPITGYRIQRNATTLVNNTGMTQTIYIDSGLLIGHQQTYRVAAWNAVGLGPYSNEATGKPVNQTSTTAIDINNLGQLVSDFAHRHNELFKQQREDTINAIKDCHEKIRNASPENRKQVRDECQKEFKALGEKNREAKRQFQQEFKEFRDNAKSIIKDAKENKIINKADVKEFKQDLKSFQKETKNDKKDFAKAVKEIKKELANQDKEHKKATKNSKPKQDEKED